MTEMEKWMLGCTIVMALATVSAVVISIVALNRKQDVKISPQPLPVQFVEQFAAKHDFVGHVADNDKQRGILHKRIDDVIKDYNDKFQALPNEIITLLRNSGALRNLRRDE